MPPLQYVILRHQEVAEPHFDLMFETLPGSQLATWRAMEWPLHGAVALKRLKDHRRVFLNYEGDLTGHRGSVIQIARGDCEVEVGEGAVWTLRLLTGAPPQTLVLRQVSGEQWQGEPS